MPIYPNVLLLFLALLLPATAGAGEITAFKRGEVVVKLDVNEVPELKEWGTKAAHLAVEWHPRICNLLPSKGVTPSNTVTIRIIKSEEGVASTQRDVITVSSHWIEKHPEDLGLIVHELVHVIQGYPNGEPWWITEGIADFIRRVILEGKPQSYFPVPAQEQGYQQGHNVAAGFLFWLETDRAPGIVNRLNTAMRTGQYSDDLFKAATQKSLDALWQEYQTDRNAES